MKTKTITFNDYILTRKENEGKSHNEIFNEAFSDSREVSAKRMQRKNVVKFFSIGAAALLISTVVLMPSNNAFADVLGMQKLAEEQNFIVYKLQLVGEFYEKCLNILGLEKFPQLFVKITKEFLTKEELYYFVKAAKGMTLDEVLKLLPSLPTL